MDLQNNRIIVDTRERVSRIPDMLKEYKINIDIKTLSVGDYILATDIVVERKSIDDFMASVCDGRLFRQCHELKKHFQNPMILIEGNMDKTKEAIAKPNIFYDAISEIAIDFKIPIISTPSTTHTAKLLASMHSRINHIGQND